MSWAASLRVRSGGFELVAELGGGRGPVALVGPNGSGKTTLLRALVGAGPRVRGRVEVDGDLLLDSATGLALPPERRRVGYVPQGYGLFPHLDAASNVAFGLPGRRAEARSVALELLGELDIAELATLKTGQLSGGQQQRVALARALAARPRLLLLDEPLAALDATSRRRVRSFLARRLRSLDLPSLVVTHDAQDVAALEAAVVVIEAGRVVQRGTLAELRARPATDFVAEFVGLGAQQPITPLLVPNSLGSKRSADSSSSHVASSPRVRR